VGLNLCIAFRLTQTLSKGEGFNARRKISASKAPLLWRGVGVRQLRRLSRTHVISAFGIPVIPADLRPPVFFHPLKRG